MNFKSDDKVFRDQERHSSMNYKSGDGVLRRIPSRDSIRSKSGSRSRIRNRSDIQIVYASYRKYLIEDNEYHPHILVATSGCIGPDVNLVV
jgi:hypothetical protein